MASSTLQLVASTFASSAPGLSSHLAASSFVIFLDIPTKNGSPSLVPAAASAAFPVVLPAVPSSVSTPMF